MSNYNSHQQELAKLQALDFTGKGEAFVESSFVTPLLGLLGYELHRDYEVIRHGDDGSSFKLQYPPVKAGAKKVRHYNPDYIPTIRKKMFWIIEAKSPKNVPYPFDKSFLVQGLQYCIHPEIQAKYLLLTNGIHSALYDAFGAVFLGKDLYQPILEFKASELPQLWEEIFAVLSVERLRDRIEFDLKAMYDKLCLSSLDTSYPKRLLNLIGSSLDANAQQIKQNVANLYVDGMNRETEVWEPEVEKLDEAQVFALMELPLRGGLTESQIFVRKCLESGKLPNQIFVELTHDYEVQSIFRKEQTFMAVCELYKNAMDSAVREDCLTFFKQHKEGNLPLLNQVECAMLRLTRKTFVLSVYTALRKEIAKKLESMPELVRFLRAPTAFEQAYPSELLLHRRFFHRIREQTPEQLTKLLANLHSAEERIEEEFKQARSKLTMSEKQIGGFEFYGLGGQHYAFRNILHNTGIERIPDPE